MTLRTRNLLSWGCALIVLTVLGATLSKEADKLARLRDIAAPSLAVLIALCLLLFLPNGLIRRAMAQHFGVRLRFAEWYGMLVFTNLLNLVLPARADMVFSAAYLKTMHGLSLANFAAMTYGNAVLFASVLVVEALLGLVYIAWDSGYWSAQLVAFALVMGVLAMALLLLPALSIRGDGRIASGMRRALDGWHSLRQAPRLLPRLARHMVLGSVIFAAWMYMSYRALGFEVDVARVLVAGVVVQLSFLVVLTPGNLGIREALTGLVSQLIGLGFSEGVIVTLLQRAVSLLVFCVVGGWFGLLLSRALHKHRELAS